MPLSGRAIEILREAEALRDASGLIFPSLNGKPLSDMTLSKLVKELGYDVDVRGFRTSFRTWAQEQAYARSDVYEKRRKMMESWAGYLEVRRGEVVRLG